VWAVLGSGLGDGGCARDEAIIVRSEAIAIPARASIGLVLKNKTEGDLNGGIEDPLVVFPGASLVPRIVTHTTGLMMSLDLGDSEHTHNVSRATQRVRGAGMEA
jgi:hypothetical protein